MRQKLRIVALWLSLLGSSFGTSLAQTGPQEVVNTFLYAWNTQEYPTMYQALHPQSQDQYSLEAFTAPAWMDFQNSCVVPLGITAKSKVAFGSSPPPPQPSIRTPINTIAPTDPCRI